MSNVLTFEIDFTISRLQQPDGRSTEGGFSTTTFTNQAERFGWTDVEAHSIHSPNEASRVTERAVLYREVDFKASDLQEWGGF
jgi:hypothetical protein